MKKGLLFLAVIIFFISCKEESYIAEYGVMTISKEQTQSWVRNFNPLAPGANARWPSVAGIYEPLFIYNSIKSEVVPWLGVSYDWKEKNKALLIKTRSDVKWSDGEKFSAYDVEFTFRMKKKFPALDGTGNWKYLSDVVALDSNQVLFTFSRVYVPGFEVLSGQPIVPKHIWKNINDPVKFTNPNPVGTGPFTEVTLFTNQIWELSKNPLYWQSGKPKIQKLRFPAFLSNEQATLALIKGEVDWSGNFIPAIERIFVDKDPENNHYWFPKSGGSIFFYLNTTISPFNNKDFRKAISIAIDRDLIAEVAMYGYTNPSHQTAISGSFEKFRLNEEMILEDWISYSPSKAIEKINSLGYKKNRRGYWQDKDGKEIIVTIGIVSGWADWIRAGQIISKNLNDIGIKSRIKTQDFGAWFNDLQMGEFSAAISWAEGGATPYPMYEGLMASKNIKAIGEPAGTNWHRFGVDEVDSLVSVFERSSNEVTKRNLIYRMQEIFIEEAPAIPLFADPTWGVYSTKRFTNFPSIHNPYAQISPNKTPENLFILTEVEPR